MNSWNELLESVNKYRGCQSLHFLTFEQIDSADQSYKISITKSTSQASSKEYIQKIFEQISRHTKCYVVYKPIHKRISSFSESIF